jgi:hypothetical protein
MILKTLQLKDVGVERHLNVDKLAIFGFAAYIETYLAVVEVADGRLVENQGDNGKPPADDGGQKRRKRATRFGGVRVKTALNTLSRQMSMRSSVSSKRMVFMG